METATPTIRDLARRLIALEAARESSDGPVGAAVRACEKLRVPLARLAGVAGFRSLLSRALSLASAKIPWLESVTVREDGSLAGFDASGSHPTAVPGEEPGAEVLAQLLGLLVTFIGDNLTRQLVRDAWPGAGVDETDPTAGGRP